MWKAGVTQPVHWCLCEGFVCPRQPFAITRAARRQLQQPVQAVTFVQNGTACIEALCNAATASHFVRTLNTQRGSRSKHNDWFAWVAGQTGIATAHPLHAGKGRCGTLRHRI